MAKVLGRSRSMRLRSSPKDPQPDAFPPVPAPLNLYKNGPEGNTSWIKSRADSAVTMSRPRTSSGDSRDRKSAHPKHVPIVINPSAESFDFRRPQPNAAAFYTPSATQESTIGMALGSPTQAAPATFAPQPPERVRAVAGVAVIANVDVREKESHPAKPKLSRWKSIFGKKQPDQSAPQPFYLAQPVVPQRQHLGSDIDVHSAFRTPSPAGSPMVSSTVQDDWTRTTSAKLPGPSPVKNRSLPPRNASLAIDPSRVTSMPRPKESPLPPPKDFPSPQIPRVTVSSEPSAPSPATPPLLDIDIPKIEMERYSVMFSSLLGNNRNSSLLVRRQGNAEKLKPLDERSLNSSTANLKPQRRATSPTIKRSPLSLFPNDSRPPIERSGTLNRPRPLQRSRTMPGAASPSRKSFDHSDDGYSEGLPTAGLSAGLSTAGLTDDGEFASPASLSYGKDRETLALQSLRKNTAWKPEMDEPAWEIINRPIDPPIKSSPPKSKTTTLTIMSPPPSAHVGVARTVSVSRPNKVQLLQPKVPSPDKMVHNKPLTPTLVELRTRKSHRVQIVDA